MKSLYNKIKNLFKVVKILSTDDSGDFQYGQVSYLGKDHKVLIFYPYGLVGKPPANSMGILWSQQGQESNGIGIAGDPKTRPLKDLKDGESALVNHVTGDYVYLKENGDLHATVSGDLIADVGGNSVANVGGNAEITAGGDAKISAGGDAELTAVGDAKISAVNVEIISTTMTHNGVNIGRNHTHPQADDSNGDSQQDVGGPQ